MVSYTERVTRRLMEQETAKRGTLETSHNFSPQRLSAEQRVRLEPLAVEFKALLQQREEHRDGGV